MQITCVVLDETRTRVEALGNCETKSLLSLDEAVEGIEAETLRLFTEEHGRRAEIVTTEREGRPYLKTKADDFVPNNLEALGSCYWLLFEEEIR